MEKHTTQLRPVDTHELLEAGYSKEGSYLINSVDSIYTLKKCRDSNGVYALAIVALGDCDKILSSIYFDYVIKSYVYADSLCFYINEVRTPVYIVHKELLGYEMYDILLKNFTKAILLNAMK